MKPALLILAVLVCLPLLAVEPVQTYAWNVDGVRHQMQTIDNISVEMFIDDIGSHTRMAVRVTNLSANAIVEVDPTRFTLTETSPVSQALKYKTENDLVSSVNRGVMWKSLFAGLAAGMASYPRIATYSYDAQAQLLDVANQAQVAGQTRIDTIHQECLRTNTLYPNQSVDGAVFFGRDRKATSIEATVTIDTRYPPFSRLSFSFTFPPDASVPPPPTAPDNVFVLSPAPAGTVTPAPAAPLSFEDWAENPSGSTAPAAGTAPHCFMLATSREPFCPSNTAANSAGTPPAQ